jgi:hypothetical protein
VPGDRTQTPQTQLPHAARTRRIGARTRMSISSCASAPPQPMHRGQLPTDCCRHARVDGPQRPSGRTAHFPQREPHPITIMSPALSQPGSWTKISMGARAHTNADSANRRRLSSAPRSALRAALPGDRTPPPALRPQRRWPGLPPGHANNFSTMRGLDKGRLHR